MSSIGTQQGSYELSDKSLIRWLKTNHNRITLIDKLPYEIYGRTERLVDAIDNLDENKSLFEQSYKVDEIWRNLIGKAIVYLKFRDAREMYHDDEDYGVEKLDEFFRTFRGFEPLLYGAQEEHYRDHMAHMLSVFIIGELLIRNTIGFDKIDVGDKGFSKKAKVSPSEKEAMWCIMALTHDLGIALERITDISPKVKDMLEKFGIINMQELSYPFLRLPLHDLAIQIISSDLKPLGNYKKGAKRLYNTHIHSKYLLKFSEAYERRDHGIISCLVLLRNLVYFLETDYLLDLHKPLDEDDARQFLIRRNILRAIAAHNNDNVYYLSLCQFPFLLTIFDELHEWGRPSLIEIFERERLEKKVFVEDLSENAIHYKIVLMPRLKLEPGERKRVKKEILRFFIGKCEKIRRILRSAVGGSERNLKLTLEVCDELEDEKVECYKIIHEKPDTIKYSVRNSKGAKEITWQKLLEMAKSNK